MKKTLVLKFYCFFYAIVGSAGLGFVSPAFAQFVPFIIDLNNKKIAKLDGLFGYGHMFKAMNDRGQLVGRFETGGANNHTRAFIIGADGAGMTDLGTLGGGDSEAFGINNAGQVVGDAELPDGNYHAFLTGPNGAGMTDLGTLGGDRSGANAINAAGQVVGWSEMPGGGIKHAFITGPNGVGMTDLGTLGGYYSFANGINNFGQVVGWADSKSGSHAFITGPNGVGMIDLGTLGKTYTFSDAVGINDAGQVAGYSRGAITHAFVAGPDGRGMTDLNTLGGNNSEAYGINNAGQIVGNYDTQSNGPHAFITGPNGVDMVDLNSLVSRPAGLVLTWAWSINNTGEVSATGYAGMIPEPSSYVLMLAGLALLGFLVRVKQKI